ncbi:iron ABC transporter permease [Myroides marinus]|uniref:ABC transporter n=1 Tax=Myroides marinus TaxID=703342 RepID=A0A163ZJJ4_9FLAO|nr:iron ABC transporter permease [Myroides marinus]KZE81888.1 ABC transporter [Myroides marinus]MDM1362208.1 iron ABC transporter permease [Myroides marinus]MDM1380090.1 iron ABC transporter permease [Myroides marinus]MDM1387353.1 iron ABC transporter permease [Myroides marinus]MDM1389866.1 iron ABC transporter permease [Myroides marinus]
MKQNKRKYWYLIILLMVVCCIAVWAMLSGQIPITLNDLQYIINPSTEVAHSEEGIKLSIVEEVLFTMRMPRVMMAIGVGAALAICGAVMQSTVQNPLADPFLLGISSGASLGATVAIVLGIGVGGSVLSELGIPVMAFIGASVATLFIFMLSIKNNRVSTLYLILAGTVINAFCAALSNALVYVAEDSEKVRAVAFWTMGSLAQVSWTQVGIVFVALFVVLIYFLLHAKELDAMMMGNESAVTLGINPNVQRVAMIVLVTVLTSLVVSFCGVIGFVGLTIPHIVRSLVGSKHYWTLLYSAVIGAFFLVGADWLSRVLIPQSEVAIGILTALIGCPLFAIILLTNKKRI